jgi:GH25 family lysozyme M1 (1,4-beta-N-acetylmuramidase)
MAIVLVDVSQYQGAIDGAAFARAGIRGAYVEAQRGNDAINPLFTAQVKAFRDEGIPVGAYLFTEALNADGAHANRDPEGQVELFYQASGGLGEEAGELPPMLDMEWPEEPTWTTWGVTAASIASWHEAAAAAVDARWSRVCGIYCDPDFAAVVGVAARCPSFASRRLWAAAYPIAGVVSTPPTSSPPRIAPWAAPTLWQFTDKYPIPGFGTVDASVFLGDEDAFAAFLAK